MKCIQFIQGKLIKNRQDLSGYTTIAWSKNFDSSLVEPTHKAVFLGKESQLSDFHCAFALGQVKMATGTKMVLTRFLWNDQDSGRGVLLHKHHLLLTWEQFLALGGSFRPLTSYFYRRYPKDVMPTLSEFGTLPDEIEVAGLPESERLATLWSRLKPIVEVNFVANLLLALFEAKGISINGVARTKNPRADEEQILEVVELLTLLLPLSWRPHLTFATRLFEAERSPAQLKFDTGREDNIRVQWGTGAVWRASSRRKEKVWSVYVEEIALLLEAQAFDELVQYMAQVERGVQRGGEINGESQLGTPHGAMQLYRAWEPVTEARFISRRLDKNQVTPQRWLVLLQSGRLNSQQTARGLATLTKLMLRGLFLEHQDVIPCVMVKAEAAVYQAEVSPALPQAPKQAKQLFQAWLQVKAFREPLACRELTSQLVDLLAQHSLTEALDFVAMIWNHFPTQQPLSRTDLLAACLPHATTFDAAKLLIEQSWQLSQLTCSDLVTLHGADGLNLLPLTKRLVALLAKIAEREEPGLLYQAYREEWQGEPKFLFGVIAIALDHQHSDVLHSQLWDASLVHLARQPAIRAESAYRTLLHRLLDVVSEKRLTQMNKEARRQQARLACLFGRFEGIRGILQTTLSDTTVREAWLDDLRLLFQQQNDSDWMEAQVKSIISDPKWSNRAIQLRFDDCLRVADALEWSTIAQPAIMQTMQLLQDAADEITIYSPRSQQLLDWLLQHKPTLSALRQLLICYVCRDALRGDMLWSEVVKRLLTPPISPADLAWFRDNLQALLGLTLNDRIQSLVALDDLAPSSLTTEMRGILDDALNDLHADWLLAQPMSNQAPSVTALPALKTERSPSSFMMRASLAQARATLKALLVWERQWQGLNWLAEAKVGLTFLKEVIQKANQEEFMPDTMQLIAHIQHPKVRQYLFEACREPLANQLYQTWSFHDQENNPARDLIQKVAHVVVTMYDSTPIAMLGEALDSLDPPQLYILLQADFALWQELQKHAQAERSTVRRWFDFLLRRRFLTINPAQKESIAMLRTVWMAKIAQLRAQRQQLTDSWKCSFEQSFERARLLFQQASQAYPEVFKELTDLDEFVLLALQLTFLHPKDSAQNMAAIWHDYQRLVIQPAKKHQQPAKHFNDILLPQAVSELQRDGQLDDEGIKAILAAAEQKAPAGGMIEILKTMNNLLTVKK